MCLHGHLICRSDHKCLCFQKDKEPGGAKLVGISHDLHRPWACRGKGEQAQVPEGLLCMAPSQVLGHLVVVWV